MRNNCFINKARFKVQDRSNCLVYYNFKLIFNKHFNLIKSIGDERT